MQNQCYAQLIPNLRTLILLLLLAGTHQYAMAQQGCAALTPTFERFNDCCWRLRVSNTSECTPAIRLVMDAATFSSYTVNTGGGWTGTLNGPNEITLTHSGGFVPIGQSTPLSFCLPPTVSTSIDVLWDFTCGIGESCTVFPSPVLEACPDPMNAVISGTAYRECNGLPLQNQTPIPGRLIQLFDESGNTLIKEELTDAVGQYAFYDLPKGQYIVKELAVPGWTPNVPATGQSAINLDPSEQVIQNFGLCPSCSCDSIYVDVVEQPGLNDTSTYYLSVTNNDEFCFPYIDVVVDSGQLLSWQVLQSGFSVEPLGQNRLRVFPPLAYWIRGTIIPISLQISGTSTHRVTATTNHGVGTNCRFPFVFPQPPPVVNKSCCPLGSTPGPELVINGDFTNTIPFAGYGSQYNYSAGGTGAGNFAIMNGVLASSANGSLWSAVGKSGNPNTDYFIVADGSLAPNRAVWFQDHTLSANTAYYFSAFVNNLVSPTYNFLDPQIVLEVVDNAGAGSVVAASAPLTLTELPNKWVNICLNFTTPAVTVNPYRLRIRSLITAGGGNDFVVDCISMRACLPQPCSANITVTPLNNCGLVQVMANPGGTGPFSYQWCDGHTGQSYTVQVPLCVPQTFCVSITCADGTVSTATASYTAIDQTPPTIQCGGFVTILGVTGPAGNCVGNYLGTATATDNCDPNPSITRTPSGFLPPGVSIIIWTAMDDCGNTATCVQEVLVQCCDGCPQGSTPGPDLIVNGNFSAGNTGFASSYASLPPSCSPGEYTVANNTTPPVLTSLCNNWSGLDHTNGVLSGNMFVADGSQTPGTVAWREPFNATANTRYSMCAFANNLNEVSFDRPDPIVQAWILDNTLTPIMMIASTGLMPESPDVWVMMNGSWVAPVAVSNPYYLAFVTAGTSFEGNNFALDDISFRACAQPCDAAISITPQGLCGQILVSASSNAAQPSYQWCSGQTTQSFTTQAPPCVPQTYCVSVTCSDGTVATATATYTFVDQAPPQLNCPPFVSILGATGATGVCSATYQGTILATDNCDPTVTLSNNAPAVLGAGPTTIVWTGTDDCGNIATCSQQVVVDCCKDCPPNTIPGPELILNGTFTAGNTGFASAYVALPPTCLPGEYTVANNVTPPILTSLCNNWSGLDHTLGAMAGNLFVADGSVTLGVDAWRQAVNLSPNTLYNLCAFANNLNEINFDRPDPIVEAWILDNTLTPVTLLATTGMLPENPDVWVNMSASWTSPAALTNPYYLVFRTSGTSFEGNNFALDDISFRACKSAASCTCGTFSDLNYRPFQGAPNISIKCGDSLTVDCNLSIPWTLNGLFACQGNNCPAPTPMFWTLQDPSGAPVTNGPMSANPNFTVSIPSATFSAAGLYTLTLGGICGTDTCYCKFYVKSPGCDTCECGVLEWAQFYREWDWNKPIACNNPNPLKVPCLKQGQNYFIHGNFTCSSKDCSSPFVDWVLTRPSLPAVTGTLAAPFYPHFDLSLPGVHFTQAGTYTLTITRYCGSKPCSCTFTFEVLPCDCNCNQLQAQVSQGFSVSGSVFTCKRQLKPIANLCANDVVKWYVGGPNVGTTVGSAPFMYTFPGSGIYWVCMVVTRIDPLTGQVCTFKRCRWVKVKCFGPLDPITVCDKSLVRNGDFSEGLKPGHIGQAGEAAEWEWFPNAGDGAVFADTSGGAGDDGYLIFNGGKDNFGAVYQRVDLESKGFINLDYNFNNLMGQDLPAGTVLEFRLHVDSMPGSANQVLYTHEISSDTSAEGWQYKFVSIPAPNLNPDFHFLVICCRNTEGLMRSTIGLDNLTICTSDAMQTDTDDAGMLGALRIMPNPTPGVFNVELPEPPAGDLQLRVMSLTGQVLMQQAVQPGQRLQTMDATNLPSGMYLLQVLRAGAVIGVDKFVKE